MPDLEYRFTNDVLFKWLFTRNQNLLKRLVAGMLRIPLDSINEFYITNPDIPPEVVEEKLCRLDIAMVVDGNRIGLEVQVSNEGDFPERSLYYWAREYSSALKAGGEYIDLPRTIIISILNFKQFSCAEYFSQHMVLEVTRHTLLTDRLCLQYYELPKLPDVEDSDDELLLWLSLFNAKTEDDLSKIEAIGGDVMKEAIDAYRTVTATDEFRQLARMRADALNIEASALGHARREAIRETEEKWQGIVEDTEEKWQGIVEDTEEKWQGIVEDKDAELAKQAAEIELLRTELQKQSE